MLDALSLLPRLIVRALDDLHTLADGVRRLTEREGDLADLLEAVRELPRVEDELSARVELVQGRLDPLLASVADLDQTAEALEKALAGVQVTITDFHAELRDLRDRIPGI